MVQVDWTVGQVLDALRRSGLADNTLVIFTSDNGPEITGEVKPGVYDRAQQYGHYSMGPLRGAKRDAWEGGHRVPFLARWPGKITAGSVSDETIAHVDLMATVAALLGVKLPENAGEDSFNLLPVLLGTEGATRRPRGDRPSQRLGQVRHPQGRLGADRRALGRRQPPAGRTRMVQAGARLHGARPARRAVRPPPGPVRSARNHYAEQPEVVRTLKELLEKYKRDGRSTPGTPQKNDVPLRDHNS